MNDQELKLAADQRLREAIRWLYQNRAAESYGSNGVSAEKYASYLTKVIGELASRAEQDVNEAFKFIVLNCPASVLRKRLLSVTKKSKYTNGKIIASEFPVANEVPKKYFHVAAEAIKEFGIVNPGEKQPPVHQPCKTCGSTWFYPSSNLCENFHVFTGN